jgi:hypothetical protein
MQQEYYDYQSKICNPRYSGGGGRGIKVQEQSRQKQEIPSEKETEKQSVWGHGSSDRVLPWQGQGPEFKVRYVRVCV